MKSSLPCSRAEGAALSSGGLLGPQKRFHALNQTFSPLWFLLLCREAQPRAFQGQEGGSPLSGRGSMPGPRVLPTQVVLRVPEEIEDALRTKMATADMETVKLSSRPPDSE